MVAAEFLQNYNENSDWKKQMALPQNVTQKLTRNDLEII